MTQKRLEDFLTKKQEEQKEKPQINLEEIKDDWLRNIKVLYDGVNDWLDPFIKKNTVTTKYEEMEINEEYLGTYRVSKMILNISGDIVELVPIGRFILGVRGRIDMIGPNGKKRFLLVDKNADGPKIIVNFSVSSASKHEEVPKDAPKDIELMWKIGTNPPKIKFLNLDADSFADSLLEVLNG